MSIICGLSDAEECCELEDALVCSSQTTEPEPPLAPPILEKDTSVSPNNFQSSIFSSFFSSNSRNPSQTINSKFKTFRTSGLENSNSGGQTNGQSIFRNSYRSGQSHVSEKFRTFPIQTISKTFKNSGGSRKNTFSATFSGSHRPYPISSELISTFSKTFDQSRGSCNSC